MFPLVMYAKCTGASVAPADDRSPHADDVVVGVRAEDQDRLRSFGG